MHQIAIAIAKMLPDIIILDKLEESIKKYKADPTDDNKNTVQMYCHFFAIKQSTKNETVEETIASAEKIKNLHDTFENVDFKKTEDGNDNSK